MTNIVAMEQGSRLRPVYGVVPEQPLEERIVENCKASAVMGPFDR